MSNAYHTPAAANAPAFASVINDPLGQLDAAIGAQAALTTAVTDAVSTLTDQVSDLAADVAALAIPMPPLRFRPMQNEPPASAYATLDTRNSHPVLDFDAGTDESAVFRDILPTEYGGGGLTVRLLWAATSATSGNCIWNVAIERLADEAQDIDSDGFASVQAATAAAPATSGMVQYTTITFTNGAQMDSLAAGEMFRLKVTRDADNGSDTMTGDAELLMVEVRET